MSAPWKTVRVFISSTFRDMQAERDWLVRFVFPRLREELLKYRIHFVDVDLRWGVTSDQNALGVCREVIDDCQPRFMCMLGGRYGWVPDGQDKSITADEIHYGVLGREAEKRGHSFFYFRDERATARMVEEDPGDFREPDGSDSARKLAALKKAIGDAGLNPRIYGEDAQWDAAQKRLTGLEAFGNLVHADLLQSLKDDPELAARFTTDGTAPPDEFAEEADQMEAFIEERSQPEQFILGSREPLLRDMLAFANADGTPNIFVLTGDPGSGKSALLAKFTRELPSDLSTLNPQLSTLLLPHFIGASTGSTDLRRTLRRLCHELAPAAGNTEPLPLDIKDLITHFQKLLAEAAGRQRVVLVFDALNQFDATDGAHWLNWLPRELPPGVRIVASVIAPADGQPGHQTLAILRTRPGTRMEKLEPLTEADTLAVIEGSLRRYAKRLSPEQLAALLAKPAGRLPLYVLTALEELRTLGTYEEITERIRTLPGDARALFGWILNERLARDPGFRDREGRPCGAALVEKFAACLGVSRHGLSPAELTALLDPGDPLGNVAALLRLLRPYLMRRGELLDFYHGQFREAAGAAHLDTPEKQRAAHQSVATCLQAFADPHRDGQCRDATPHALSELPHHQTRAEAWPELIATLENIFFLEAKVTHGMAFELAEDFPAAVDALPPKHTERQRLRLLGAALRRDIHFIARHSKDYPQALFQCLWNSAWWHDCPEAETHYVDTRSPAGTVTLKAGKVSFEPDHQTADPFTLPPPWRRPGLKVSQLLEKWREEKAACIPGTIWLRSLRPAPIRLDADLIGYLTGHEEPIGSVACSGNGRFIASGSWDRTVRIWDQQSGKPIQVLCGHKRNVLSVAFSLDGRLLASASDDCSLRIWDPPSGRQCIEVDTRQVVVICVCFSQDGRLVAGGCADNSIRLWESTTGIEIAVLMKHRSPVTCLAFAPDETHLASGSLDGTIRIVNVTNGGQVALLNGHRRCVRSLAFCPDGRSLVSAAEDNTVRIWDLHRAMEIDILCPDISDRWRTDRLLTSLALAPDGHTIAIGTSDNFLRLQHLDSGAILGKDRDHGHPVMCVAFSSKGHELVAGSANVLSRWRVRTLSDQELSEKEIADRIVKRKAFADEPSVRPVFESYLHIEDNVDYMELPQHKQPIEALAFSADASYVATSSRDRTVRLWDAKHGIQHTTLSAKELFQQDPFSDPFSFLERLAFSSDGNKVIGYTKSNSLFVWDVRSRVCSRIDEAQVDFASARVSEHEGPFRLVARDSESIVQSTRTRQVVAWFPTVLTTTVSSPLNAIWAGSNSKQLYLLALDGDIESTVNHDKEVATHQLRTAANDCFKRHFWEAAAAHFQNLLAHGAPLSEFGPKLITCLLNAHEDLMPHDAIKIEDLLCRLKSDGHTDLVADLRRQLEAKQPKPKKPWWKPW